MERLIDDCIIMDYGSILIQKPVPQLLDTFRRYTFRLEAGAPETLPVDGNCITARLSAAAARLIRSQTKLMWADG